jgi:hypothetical protein
MATPSVSHDPTRTIPNILKVSGISRQKHHTPTGPIITANLPHIDDHLPLTLTLSRTRIMDIGAEALV